METVIATLLMLWVLAAALSAGLRLLYLIGLSERISRQERLFYGLGLGFVLLVCAMMILGFFSLWYRSVAYGLIFIMSLSGIDQFRLLFARSHGAPELDSRNPLCFFSKIVLFVLVGHIVVNFFSDLVPPLNGDTLGLYLVWPKIWVEHHGIGAIRDDPWSLMPVYTQMISALGLLLQSDILSQLLAGFSMSVLAAGVVYVIARQRFSRDLSLLAMAVFYCTPVTTILTYSAKNDLFMAFCELLAFSCFLNFVRDKNEPYASKWVVLFSLFCGCSIGIKYLFFASIIIFLGLVVLYFKSDNLKSNGPRFLRYGVTFVLICGVIGLPIYVRNLFLVGNPFYPLLSEVFDTGLLFWTLRESGGLWGYFVTFWEWSNVPFRGYSIGPAFLMAMPLLAFCRRFDHRIRAILLMVFVQSLLCYAVSSRPRHMLSGIGLLSIAAAYGIDQLRSVQRILKYGLAILVVCILLANQFLAIGHNLFYHPKIPYLLGWLNRQEFLRQALSGGLATDYVTICFMNDALPKNSRILIVGPFHPYYVDRITVYGWDVAVIHDEEEIRNYLLRKRITHVFVNPYTGHRILTRDEIKAMLETLSYLETFRNVFNDSGLFADRFASNHLELIHQHREEYLFRLKLEAQERPMNE